MPEEHWNLEANEEAGQLKNHAEHHCKNCKCKPLTKLKEDKDDNSK